jgi:hypothetical protein
MHERARALLVLLAVTLILPGCMTFEVAGNASITEASVNGHETVHGSLYRSPWKAYPIQKCDKSAIARVEYQTNGLLLLASVASLGLYVPQTVEWWCDDPSRKDDEHEDEPSPDDEFSTRSGRRLGGSHS